MIRCSRCQEDRWPFGRVPAPYVCQRCQEVLRGSKYVIDPLAVRSEAQQAVTRRLLLGRKRPQERR